MGRDTIRDSIKTLGKLVIAATLTNPLGKAAAEAVLERITALLSKEEKDPLKKIENNLIAELEAYTNEGLPDDLLTVSMGNAKSLFENCALSLSDLVDLNLDPQKAADKLMERGDRLLENQYKTKCRELIFRIYKAFLSGEEAEKIPGLHIAIDKAMLKNFDELRKLPNEIINTFTERSAQALISSHYMPIKKHFPPTALLRAEHCIVPFHPVRIDLCSKLESWFDLDIPIGVKLITGSGGSGKTRLCMELAKRLRINRDIKAGFLDSRADRASDDVLDRLIPGNGSILLVIDYAETRSGITEKILMRAADYEGDEKIRIILLSRSAGDWWEMLKRSGNGVGYLISSYYPDKIELSNQDVKPEQRTDVFLKAAEALAEKRNLEKSEIITPDLNAPHFGTMLFIHLAAFAATEGKTLHGRDELIDFIIQREKRQWSDLLVSTGLRVFDNLSISQAASLLTLAGGTTRNEAPDLLKRLKIFEDQQNIKLTRLFEIFHSLYPDGERAGAVVPDLVGERLVESVIIQEISDSGNKSELLQTAFSLKGKQLQNAFTLLTRLAKYKSERESWIRDNLKKDFKRLAEPAFQAAMETGDPLGRIMAQVMKETQDVEVAFDLVEKLPDKSVAFMELALEVTKVCYEEVKREKDHENDEKLYDQAHFANNISAHYLNLNKREEALRFAKEAVNIRKRLVKKLPDSYNFYLAISFKQLSNCFIHLGKIEEASNAITEALKIYYSLSDIEPSIILPEFINVLISLSNIYYVRGLRDLALKTIHDAVTLSREVLQIDSIQHSPLLAATLSILSQYYSSADKIEDSIKFARESVDIYRELSKGKNQIFLIDLARSLNNLSNCLFLGGYRREALESVLESTDIYKRLSTLRADVFEIELADSYNNLSNRYSDLGDRKKALESILNPVRIYRKYITLYPDVLLPRLAKSLNNLSAHYLASGLREDAIQSSLEAVNIYIKLDPSLRNGLQHDFAMSLQNLSTSYLALGLKSEALKSINEAVKIYKNLNKAHPDSFQIELAGALNSLSQCYHCLGQMEPALIELSNARVIYRRLATSLPNAFLSHFAVSSTNLCIYLYELGLFEDALTNGLEAVEIFKVLSIENPEVFLPDIAVSQQNVSNCYSAIGRQEDALNALNEAIIIRRDLNKMEPNVWLPDLASSLYNLSIVYLELMKMETAKTVLAEAIEIYDNLYKQYPETFRVEYTKSLIVLSGILTQLGKTNESQKVLEEIKRLEMES
jgi:hypothetical protein